MHPDEDDRAARYKGEDMSDSPEMRPDAPTPEDNYKAGLTGRVPVDIPDTEVYMVVVTPMESGPDGPPDEATVKAVACAYDLAKGPLGGARQLDATETTENFPEFVEMVNEDMSILQTNIVHNMARVLRASEAKRDEDVYDKTAERASMRAELFLRLLMEFGDKPVELIGNLAAAFMVACIEELADSPDYEQRVQEWREALADNQA